MQHNYVTNRTEFLAALDAYQPGDTLPNGKEWDYISCVACAFALFSDSHSDKVRNTLNINHRSYEEIFYYAHLDDDMGVEIDMSQVTPQRVAEVARRVFAEQQFL